MTEIFAFWPVQGVAVQSYRSAAHSWKISSIYTKMLIIGLPFELVTMLALWNMCEIILIDIIWQFGVFIDVFCVTESYRNSVVCCRCRRQVESLCVIIRQCWAIQSCERWIYVLMTDDGNISLTTTELWQNSIDRWADMDDENTTAGEMWVDFMTQNDINFVFIDKICYIKSQGVDLP